MSYSVSSSDQPKKGGGSWSRLVFFLLITAILYSTVRYFVDRSNYSKAHQAYQQAECRTAINYFDKVINGWRLVDLGGYPALAQKEKAECIPFQIAVDKQGLGDFSMALVAYTDFVNDYSGSVLAEFARSRGKFLFEQEKPSALAGIESCEKLDSLLEKDMIPQHDVNLPAFYFACGQVFDTVNSKQDSFDMYRSLLIEYPNHLLAGDAEVSLLTNPVACDEVDSLNNTDTLANRHDFMPTLYYNCGQLFDSKGERIISFEMFKNFLIQYPEHPLAIEAEIALLDNPTSCQENYGLQKTIINDRPDFMPTLYIRCGQSYEDEKDWKNAISMYEKFLADFPSHALASDVEAALARSIVAQARASGAGEIAAPESSGNSGSELTVVIIQNDSPERLRIVFSGPESHIEELEACSSCTEYTGIGPLYCPEQGPIGHYTLLPGQYDVVVESIGYTGTTPWTGIWDLVSGDEYYNCFFVVTTLSP